MTQAEWEKRVAEAMRDAWTEICEDTGCHPLDILQLGRRRLLFVPNHWATFTAARLAAPERQGWMPIDTAPRNGERVDIWLEPYDAMESGNSHRRPNAYFHAGDWWFSGNGVAHDVAASHHWRVTHWMPLPTAPSTSGTSEGSK